MNEFQGKDSWAKVKLFGDYNEVKDIIWELPRTKETKYFYVIFTSNFKVKVGVTENPIDRIKTHEHGLNVYGNARIKKILITHPTREYKKLEAMSISALALKYKKSGAEFFDSGNVFSVLFQLSEIIKNFTFHEITPLGSYYDCLMENITKYFSLFPTEDSVLIESKDLKFKGIKTDDARVKAKMKNLIRLYPEFVSKKVDGRDVRYLFKKQILELDIINPRITPDDYTFEDN